MCFPKSQFYIMETMLEKTNSSIYQRELTTLLKTSALINSSLHISDVLDSAMHAAEEFMDAEASAVYELSQDQKEIIVSLARGKKGKDIQRRRLKYGEGLSGYVIKSGKPVVLNDVQKDSRFSPRFDEQTGFKTISLICAPLVIKGRTIGALQVINKKGGHPFTDEDLELLIALAQQIAVALDNAKLYQRLEKKFKLTEQELKVTQQRLIRSERLAAMAHLVQGVAHEIRNPIMSIGGFAARIKSSLGKDDKYQKYLDIILQESTRLEKLVQEVKELAEMQDVYLEPTDINSLLKESLDAFSSFLARKSIRLKTDIPEDLPELNVDRAQIIRAIKNILQNSIEALPGGGSVIVRAKERNACIRVVIEDTGTGIDRDTLEFVHDPFYSSKTTGSGLGLTMVYQILKNHQGDIEIKSRNGKGTKVTLDIPINLKPYTEGYKNERK